MPRAAEAEDPQVATRRAVMARDAGMRRISTLTRRFVVGAVALSGALAVLAANAFHGRTIVSGNSTNASTSSASTAQQSPQTSGSDGLGAPAQSPTPTPVQPVAVSGGS
jgi:hypothetical protein